MSTALVSMEGRAQIKSLGTPVPVAQASLVPTASMRSTSVTLSPASMGESVKMPLSPSVAPAQKATLATAARYTHLQTSSLHTSMFLDKQTMTIF